MKTLLFNLLTAGILLCTTSFTYSQAPNLGSASEFVLFSTDGAVSNTGISLLTGNVGTNNGSSTNFGNVNGVMHDGDTASAKCAVDLLTAYNQLNAMTSTFSISYLMGNGGSLVPGVYSISEAATLNLDLFLDAEGNSDAVFIFLIDGAFASNSNAEIKLINGALACNVFWKVEGAISFASGSSVKGTFIANNALIETYSGCTVEGRLLSTTGSVTIDGTKAYLPIGCGSPILTGPTAPTLASTIDYTLFSSDGPVTNTGITKVIGDVGTNVGLTTGFDAKLVDGVIHPIPDASTAACAADLLIVYTYLNTLPMDIELLYPAQFGNDLVLTPHTYVLNGAVDFTGDLYLNALGNADAVFVINIYGALSTSTFSHVILTNGTQAKNVFWKVDGAVEINDSSIFNGNIVSSGAIALNNNVLLNGSALTLVGALTIAASEVNNSNKPLSIIENHMSNWSIGQNQPNPVMQTTQIPYTIPEDGMLTFNVMSINGQNIHNELIQAQSGSHFIEFNTQNLSNGIYYYSIIYQGVSICKKMTVQK